MPAVTSIQQGAVTIVVGDGLTKDVTISAVTIANALVVFTHRNADTQGRDLRHFFTAELTSTTNLRFTRNSSAFATQVDIEWTVIEYATATVQTGSIAADAATETIAITDVDETRAFAVSSMQTDLNLALNTSIHSCELDGTGSNVLIKTNATPGAGDLTARWQVVEFASGEVSVQTVQIALTASDITKTATISSVTPSKAFIVHGGQRSAQVNGLGGRNMSLQIINSATEVEARRQNIGTLLAMDCVLQVAELLDASAVQSGIATIADTATAPTQPTFSALTNGAVINTSIRGNARTTAATDPAATNLLASILLDDPPDGLTIQRVGSSGALEVAWFAVDWSGAAAAGGGVPNGLMLLGLGN